MRRLTLTSLILLSLGLVAPSGQLQLQPVSSLRGAPGLEIALRKLDTVGTFMMTTAHPDDENNAMLAYFSHGKGYRTTLVTATHGEGGQNEIGPELFEALAVLRTEELAAAHRFDGAEQFFTRAIDFGYSFSIEETLAKWGKPEILGDFVRMIRTIRPDVMVGFVYDGDGGGQHHQTSTRLALEAFRAAADPAQYPEQIKEGLRPWQARKFYYTAGFGGGPGGRGGPPAALPGEGAPTLMQFVGGDEFDDVLGRTYGEIAGEARSMHKCQGMSQLLPLPAAGGGPFGGGGPRGYRLRDTVLDGGVARREREIYDGVDTSLRSLTAFAGAAAPADLGSRLDTIAAAVADARKALAAGGTNAAVAPLVRGLKALKELRASLASLGLNDTSRYEIDFRLAQKEPQFANAVLLASDTRLEAVAGDALATPDQQVPIELMAGVRGDRKVAVKASVNGFAGNTFTTCEQVATSTPPAPLGCKGTARIPADARLTAAHFHTGTEGARYVFDSDVPFGLPFRPTPFTATFTVTIDEVSFAVTLPIQARTEADLFSGEKRHEIIVVPAFAVTTTPEIVVVPTRANPANVRGTTKDVRVSVINHARGAAKGEVSLELPTGWTATPATQPVTFSREDEAMTVRFALMAPPPPTLAAAAQKPGGNQFTVKAVVKDAGKTYAQGYQLIEYPHTTRRHVLQAPQLTVKALDVAVKPNLTVGYVMGVGDEVPQALEQLGVNVSFITPDEMAWGDLSKYSVIVTGVRAYERRADLRAYNNRLLDYARAGGTVIVQYNKFEFNDAQYGPFPARVGRERVTDENAETKVLAPSNPVFTTPNAIGRADWTGWVQERGLYFLDTQGRDAQMVDLLEFTDPFEYNQGAKRGALVEAQVGKGKWLYIGLGLWRQLPAGTDGAYRLMANLLSLGR